MKTTLNLPATKTNIQFSQEELQAAFDAVANATDWKAPISARITMDRVLVTYAAIEHFTATEAKFIPSAIKGEVLVMATGYRMGPAGDH